MKLSLLRFLILFTAIFLIIDVNSLKCDPSLCYATNADSVNVCISPSDTNLSPGDGTACLGDCSSNANKCKKKGSFLCIDKDASVTKNGSNECECTGTECFNAELNKCITIGSSGLIANTSTGICECSTATNCYLPFSSYDCVDPSSFSYNKGDYGECKCAAGECIDDTDSNNCKTRTSSLLSYEDGKKCVASCDANDCYSTIDYLCITPSSTTNLSSTVTECTCDTNYCFNTSSCSCMDITGKTTQYTSGISHCICDTSDYCFNPDTAVCVSNSWSQTNKLQCNCGDDNKCFDSSNSTCVDLSATLTNKDNGICKIVSGSQFCENTEKCFNQHNYKCIDTPLYLTPLSSGGICQCPDTSECYNPSFTCSSPSDTKVSNNDGGMCYNNTCPDVNTCYDSTFFCKQIDTGISHGINTSSESCVCTDTDQCFTQSTNDTSKLACSSPSDTKVSNKDGGMCYNNTCPDANTCYDSTYYCKQMDTAITHGMSTSSESCICSNTDQCFTQSTNDTSKLTCIDGEANKISDADGSNCKSTTCTNTSKCYHPNLFVCQDGKAGFDTGLACERRQFIKVKSFQRSIQNYDVLEVEAIYDLEDNTLTVGEITSNFELYQALRKDDSAITYATNLKSSKITFFEQFLPDINMGYSDSSAKTLVVWNITKSCTGIEDDSKQLISFNMKYFDCDNNLSTFETAYGGKGIKYSNGMKSGLNDTTETELKDFHFTLVGHTIGVCPII